MLAGCCEPKEASEDAAGVVAPPAKEDAKPSRFRHPDEDPPHERSEDQLPPDELEAALNEAAEQVKKGDDLAAIRALRKCANKLQPSPRCEGEIGIAMWKVGNHRAYARFYVEAAAAMEDPKADAGFWRRLGDTAMRMARFESAKSAYEKMVAAGGKSADDYRKLSSAMQGAKADVKDVISVLGKAYEAAPTEHDILFEIATLTAQIPDDAKARELLEEYLEKTKGKDPGRDELVKTRIKELSLPRRQ